MCGIVACIGQNVGDLAVSSLQRLQYRGYDSYGFAWVDDDEGRIHMRKSIDSLDDIQDRLPECTAVIGHTRWATHGGVNVENCHPHASAEFSLVHNGIVENYQVLKKQTCTVTYTSETDTEVIVHLLENELQSLLAQSLLVMGDHQSELMEIRRNALLAVFRQLNGRNTIVVLFADGSLMGIKDGSPLVVGKGQGKFFLGSDVLSFPDIAEFCSPMEARQLVEISNGCVSLFDENVASLAMEWSLVTPDSEVLTKEDFPHYMLKEIMEQWYMVARQATRLGPDFDKFVRALDSCDRVLVTGAGGAYFASVQIAWLLREVAGINALAIPAYEIESARRLFKSGDFLLAISQSGETADTIEAIEVASAWGLRIASLVNMPMSTLARMSEFSFANHCGPEICVLSTKSATAQVTFGYMLAKSIAVIADFQGDLNQLSTALSRYLCDQTSRELKNVAISIAEEEHLYILGRSGFYGAAQVAALNIKEASYIHAEAFAAGELKHGVIALVEKGVPVILFVGKDDHYMINVAAELKSRGAHVIAIGCEDNELFDQFILLPDVADPALAIVAAMIPCQLLAYHLAVVRGLNPDRPRNLAKSVTVR